MRAADFDELEPGDCVRVAEGFGKTKAEIRHEGLEVSVEARDGENGRWLLYCQHCHEDHYFQSHPSRLELA